MWSRPKNKKRVLVLEWRNERLCKNIIMVWKYRLLLSVLLWKIFHLLLACLLVWTRKFSWKQTTRCRFYPRASISENFFCPFFSLYFPHINFRMNYDHNTHYLLVSIYEWVLLVVYCIRTKTQQEYIYLLIGTPEINLEQRLNPVPSIHRHTSRDGLCLQFQILAEKKTN